MPVDVLGRPVNQFSGIRFSILFLLLFEDFPLSLSFVDSLLFEFPFKENLFYPLTFLQSFELDPPFQILDQTFFEQLRLCFLAPFIIIVPAFQPHISSTFNFDTLLYGKLGQVKFLLFNYLFWPPGPFVIIASAEYGHALIGS